jgi:metal-responsive CopG/Arc/MetJ family transcriptional regulator
MKEYKVISPSLGLRKRSEKLEEILNRYAKENWNMSAISNNRHGGVAFVVFEREKNR